jgi:hypothetical protein
MKVLRKFIGPYWFNTALNACVAAVLANAFAVFGMPHWTAASLGVIMYMFFRQEDKIDALAAQIKTNPINLYISSPEPPVVTRA